MEKAVHSWLWQERTDELPRIGIVVSVFVRRGRVMTPDLYIRMLWGDTGITWSAPETILTCGWSVAHLRRLLDAQREALLAHTWSK